MKLSSALAKVMDLSKTILEYWETELPKAHPGYPIAYPGEREVPPPPEEKKLAKLLASLPDEMVFQIGLLMYLGRGDFSKATLADNYKMVKERFPSPSALAAFLAGKATLADYLQEGLAELEKCHIDVDHLPLKPIKVLK